MLLLEEYKSFNTVADLNAAIYAHLCDHWNDMTDTDRNTLKILARYSVKYPGAAHLKAATLGVLIGKSEKTARRILNKLQSLGILRKITTIRPKSKGTGANIIQIQQPKASQDAPDLSSDQAEAYNMPKRSESASQRQATSERDFAPVQSSLYKSIKNHFKETDPDANAALRNTIPEELYAAMCPYFSAEELFQTIGILWRSKSAAGGSSILVEDHASAYADSFRYAVLMFKQRKIRNLSGYLFSAWKGVTERIQRKIAAVQRPDHPVFRDWLNDESIVKYKNDALDELGVY
ncbi:helix-turn-helix domain-containing protein [Bacillus sp. AG4(2022)]|uniref:helix-turn-helix domain-containing protein n=1 Tax=Bacillus sp. AG4(2022) TaxID=2962594 RepID=UPI002881695F|nr:helix-turn-helix domain-containing protein [Bacillus sp. AG4(2022)]MDT0161856.1 helix-turn-helix domain-containing protein [Bacillus sp. AG4(2022)]